MPVMHIQVEKLERAKGFEPSTPTLARLCSTPELRPLWRAGRVLRGGKAGLLAWPAARGKPYFSTRPDWRHRPAATLLQGGGKCDSERKKGGMSGTPLADERALTT